MEKESKNIKGIVYGATVERSLEKLKEIEEAYNNIGIETINRKASTHNVYITFANGDYWYSCRASESSRGMACNVAYIDYNIPTEIVNTIIKPSIKSFPYRAYNYF